ncbi:MAG: presenilin family intramembrane aspartyl protease [Candidatus Micrarchaeota archaeon]
MKFGNPIIAITLMFALTQLLGFVAGILLMHSAATDPDVRMVSISPVKDSNDLMNAVLLILYVIFGAGIMLFIIKYFRTRIFIKLMELAVVGGAVSVFAFSFIHTFSSFSFLVSMFISILIGGCFAIIKFFQPSLKNIAAILSSAGVAALFGFSVGFWPALLFIIALSIYDYIAVFKTKHMLVLAKGLGTSDMSFTITAKEKKIKAEKPSIAAPGEIKERGEKDVSRLDLGSGDLAIPAMLAVSTFPVAGIIGSLAVIAGSIISIYLTLGFVIRRQVVLPALPPICLGSLIALLLSQLIQSLL